MVFAVDSVPADPGGQPRAVHRVRARTPSPSSACGRSTSCSPTCTAGSRYLQEGLAIILAFVGVKMIIAEWYHIPTPISLGVIAAVLAGAILLSIRKDRREAIAAGTGPGRDAD